MDVYRSGHNGPDSKSGSPHGLVGSNPTASATKETLNVYQASRVLFMQKLWYFMHFPAKERQNVPKAS